MPQQNTPMKRQFTTIDGRTVMSNLPQHWGGNDWKITGVDNPLPAGNYVQTEEGVWIPQKGSDDGAADVRLTGRNVEKIIIADGVAVTTAGTYTFTGDFTKYKKVLFFIRDTHDIKCQLSIRFQVHGTTFGEVYENDEWITLGRILKLSSSADIFLNTRFPFLSELTLPNLRFDASYDEAPTSGALSITAFGVIN